MKWNYLLKYLAGAVLVLTPVGLRILSWKAPQTPVDPAMAEQGKILFNHEWKPNDPLAGGDGLGPVFNAASCVACHHQGGPGGSGGVEHNVTVFAVLPKSPGGKTREGVLHANAVPGFSQETLRDIHPDFEAFAAPDLPFVLSFGRMRNQGKKIQVEFSQRKTPALFGAKLIDEIPDRVIIAQERKRKLLRGKSSAKDMPVGRVNRLADGRVGKFGWKAQSASLSDFVQAACANELGLSNPGNPQPQPLGQPDYQPKGMDLTLDQCNQLTAFIASLDRPVERPLGNGRGIVDERSKHKVQEGKRLFLKIGCADCHTPNLGSVEGIYSDLMLHHMGESLMSQTGSYNGRSQVVPLPSGPSTGTPADEWRTPPLWGVADSAPYLHDGRANSLQEAILLHGGEALASSRRFANLSDREQSNLVAFLKTLQAP